MAHTGDFIRVSREGRFMQRQLAAKLRLREYVAPASEKRSATPLARPTAAPAKTQSLPATAKLLPPAPLAGFSAPHNMTELDRWAEKGRLRAWLDLTKGCYLTQHQRSEAEVLRSRLEYLERGFR